MHLIAKFMYKPEHFLSCYTNRAHQPIFLYY